MLQIILNSCLVYKFSSLWFEDCLLFLFHNLNFFVELLKKLFKKSLGNQITGFRFVHFLQSQLIFIGSTQNRNKFHFLLNISFLNINNLQIFN